MFPNCLLQLFLSKDDGGSRFFCFLTKQKLSLPSIFLKFRRKQYSHPFIDSPNSTKDSVSNATQTVIVFEPAALGERNNKVTIFLVYFASELFTLWSVVASQLNSATERANFALMVARCTFSFRLLVAEKLQAKTWGSQDWCCSKVLLRNVFSQPHVKDVTSLEIGVTGSWLFFFIKKCRYPRLGNP